MWVVLSHGSLSSLEAVLGGNIDSSILNGAGESAFAASFVRFSIYTDMIRTEYL
jgi:hypothetical protein